MRGTVPFFTRGQQGLRACYSGSLSLTLKPTREQPKLQNSPSFHAKTVAWQQLPLLRQNSPLLSPTLASCLVFHLLLCFSPSLVSSCRFLSLSHALHFSHRPHSPSSLHGFAAVLLHIAAREVSHSLTHAALSHTHAQLSLSHSHAGFTHEHPAFPFFVFLPQHISPSHTHFSLSFTLPVE
jgi:hypothetical protein